MLHCIATWSWTHLFQSSFTIIMNNCWKSYPQGFKKIPTTLYGAPWAPKVHPSGHKGHAMKPPVPQRGCPGHPRVPKGSPRMSTRSQRKSKMTPRPSKSIENSAKDPKGGPSKKQQVKLQYYLVNSTIQEAKLQYYLVNSSIQNLILVTFPGNRAPMQ